MGPLRRCGVALLTKLHEKGLAGVVKACYNAPMTNKQRTKAYAKTNGISTVGAFKNDTTLRKLQARLTPAQQRRLRKKVAA